jgi:hypothetical protein
MSLLNGGFRDFCREEHGRFNDSRVGLSFQKDQRLVFTANAGSGLVYY